MIVYKMSSLGLIYPDEGFFIPTIQLKLLIYANDEKNSSAKESRIQ